MPEPQPRSSRAPGSSFLDASGFCTAMLVICAVGIVFSAAGISASLANESYSAFWPLPALLLALFGVLACLCALRLARRLKSNKDPSP